MFFHWLTFFYLIVVATVKWYLWHPVWQVKTVSVKRREPQRQERECVIGNQNQDHIFFLSKCSLLGQEEWTAGLNQTTWDVIPCSVEERLDISIVKWKKWRWKKARGTERMKERHQYEQRSVGENAGESEKRTQASGTVKWFDTDSAMAVRLWLRHAHPSASHMWGGYWWSRHFQAEHL